MNRRPPSFLNQSEVSFEHALPSSSLHVYIHIDEIEAIQGLDNVVLSCVMADVIFRLDSTSLLLHDHDVRRGLLSAGFPKDQDAMTHHSAHGSFQTGHVRSVCPTGRP